MKLCIHLTIQKHLSPCNFLILGFLTSLIVEYYLSATILPYVCLVNHSLFDGSGDTTCNFMLLTQHTGIDDDTLSMISLSWIFNVSLPQSLQNKYVQWPWAEEEVSVSIEQTQPDQLSGMMNFATIESGASIISRYTSPTHGLPPVPWTERLESKIFRSGYYRSHLGTPSPHTIFEDPMKKNECWRTSGKSGHVGIKLNASAPTITSVVVDYYLPDQLTPSDRQSAPTNMSLWALVKDNIRNSMLSENYITTSPSRFSVLKSSNPFFAWNAVWDHREHQEYFVKLTDLVYNISFPASRQIFPVQPLPSVQTPTQIYLLQIKSNEGGNTTCLYSIGLYGVN